MPSPFLTFDNTISSNNPFLEKSKGSYFLYYYGDSFTGMTNSPNDFKGAANPNRSLVRRVVFKKQNGEIIHANPEPIIASRVYLIFGLDNDKALFIEEFKGKINNYTTALEALNALKSDTAFIGEVIPAFKRAPNSTNKVSPFDAKKINDDEFYYMTAAQSKYSYMCNSLVHCTMGEMDSYFPMGYTNLWHMRKLKLYVNQKWIKFSSLDKSIKEEYYVMNELTYIESFETYEEAYQYAQKYVKRHEKKGKVHCNILVAQMINNIYWH